MCHRTCIKYTLLLLIYILLDTGLLLGQTFSVEPDRGSPGTSFGVTLSGTHGTFSIMDSTCVEISGNVIYDLQGLNVSSSTITGTLTVPIGAAPGVFDVNVYQGADCETLDETCPGCFVIEPCDTSVFLDFQDQLIPSRVINLDLDGRIDQNDRPSNWYIIRGFPTSTTNENWVVGSSSWFENPGQADNWLIIGPVCIDSDEYYATWKSAPFQGPEYADGYQVLISTTTSEIDSFNLVEQFAEDISNGSGVWGPGIQHMDFNNGYGVLSPWGIDLSTYAGQTIFVAFRHNSTANNVILLDDIRIGNPIGDGAIASVMGLSEYTIYPLHQHRATPLNVGCSIENVSFATLTNALVHCNIYLEEELVRTLRSDTLSSVSVGATLPVTFSETFTPVRTGEYTCEYVLFSVEDETPSANDTMKTSFLISENVMARDDGIGDRALSLGQGETGIIGQNFTLNHSDSLFHCDVSFFNLKTGDTLSAVLYEVPSPYSAPTNLLAETPIYIVPQDGSRSVQFNFDPPQKLVAGTYFLGVRERISSVLNLAGTYELFTPNTVWFNVDDSWMITDALGFPNSFLIRPQFGSCRDSLFLQAEIPSFEMDLDHHASWSISTSDVIRSGATNIIYDSGSTIDFLPGFTIEQGATFQTANQGCYSVNKLSQKIFMPRIMTSREPGVRGRAVTEIIPLRR